MNPKSLWAVAREWPGETVFIIAGGTSVERQAVHRLAGRRVIAINSSYEAAPFADILYFADVRWWNEHRERPALKAFQGRIATVSQQAGGDTLLRLRRVCCNVDAGKGPLGPGFTSNVKSVVSQRTSLQGAMNLAAHLTGAGGRMVLLGADMRRADDGRSHHHRPHPWKNKKGNKTWDIQMAQLAMIVEPLKERGVEVLNASPISRIPWWPKVDLEILI